MASSQPSRHTWRGRDRQRSTSGSPRLRHRSESRFLSYGRPVKAVAHNCDHYPEALQVGAAIRVFSRSGEEWVDGEVVRVVDREHVRVEYLVGQYWCGKLLHVDSKHLEIPFTMDPATHAMTRNLESTPAALSPAGQPAENCLMHGCRPGLPRVCEEDPKKYYVEMDYMWTLLHQRNVVLIKGTWLLERARRKPFVPLPCRQDLPAEAIVDVEQLQQSSSCDFQWRSRRIVAISHCWLDPSHPDPNGWLLQELAPVIESYLRDYQHVHFEGAFFFAWCSLYQPRHHTMSTEEFDLFQVALENMDIWYAHQETVVWLCTKFFPGQGHAYEERGWPTWEQTVADLLGHSFHENEMNDELSVLDIGQIKPSALGQEHGDNVLSFDHIEKQCKTSRRVPLVPAEFETLIDGKHFTCGEADRKRIKANYARNFDHTMMCVTSYAFWYLRWSDCEILKLSRVLSHCKHLERLGLGVNCITDKGAIAIAQALQNCSKLKWLDLHGNRIGSDGASAVAETLQGCSELERLWFHCNNLDDDGASRFANALRHCSQLEELDLRGSRIRPEIAREIGEALSHVRCLHIQHRRQVTE